MIRDIERIYGTLLSRQYQKKLFQDLEGLQEKGDSLIARCPFHEDEHPTFIIYPDRPEYFCFVCGARGDWLGYLQLKTGMDFFGALRLLAGEAGIDPVAYDKNAWDDELSRTILLELMAGFFTTSLYSPAGERELFYLYNRRYAMGEVEGSSFGFYPGYLQTREYLVSQGLTDEFLDKVLDAVWSRDAEEFRLTIPYRDTAGRLMGMIGRDVTKKGPEAYRALTDLSILRDSPFLLYKHRGSEDLLVVEGFLDALLVDRIGLIPVAGVGKSGLSAGQCDTIASYGTRRCILCLGSGRERKDLMLKSADLVESRGMQAAFLPLGDEYEDLDHFIRATELKDFRKLLKKTCTREEYMRGQMT
ncbi:MAG: CHC2 zinc finger domain-containing protein [Desulfomonilia bacterium]|jgi:DNA primase|uniref:DNA primase (Bacterial type) n=1 Tax=anaerobic digester metagenome TaxID=1263854 RepID=A0A485LUJ6_9ZZZZ|nr:CHC2 zinc finger domain-containing protein [Pseudomonadota bacterium]HON38037.1 CHC2 zinc finger domain-containing protein [Deltaproteobacteria bacterium]HRS55260.1 CHC2 zinc finger domain-containing protein [Desulfomonilia bacterium]HPD20426.1 CHC2 zinc finger domain-containing protein [Deltaproteobacteria bacterium]HPW69409.1 CHC2 zinc finger domain-containing protein [Deltaproteobacteria bacterium]